MIYQLICPQCDEIAEYEVSVKLFDLVKEGAHCVDCECPALLIVTGGRTSFMKSPFPKGFHEHISENGSYIRDKIEGREVAAENGHTSKLIENMM